ncbi:GntR family transcriptional regulator [Paractinoplanes hotanensis]|uniref:GntR family transcriptional regulator n=1 Tax=Paractinoplanes hotanensis TaxID=2906497 RepID=A0ABT0Y8S7_9ACTN|nr:GntR family transcriptional regulator [Actinoplanes hotanensis]MCM4082447.1 GntR family transcriptional regulator [Actinoplanes hotanensis]
MTASEKVYASLRAAVLDGEFEPRQALKPQELATRHGVSLAVAREALLRLVGEGLAYRLPNRGFVVPDTGAERWQQIAETRSLVEPAALSLAVARGDLEWEAAVRAAYHRLAGTPFAVTGDWAEAHRLFHRTLLSGCGNDVVLETFDRLWTAGELARRWSFEANPTRDAAAEHEAIEQAVLARDADRAATLLRRHILYTAAVLL